MKFNIILFGLLISCLQPQPTTTTVKKELELKIPEETSCERKLKIILNLASACYLEIQGGCVKDNNKGRQAGECPTCDALDKTQEAYNNECKT